MKPIKRYLAVKIVFTCIFIWHIVSGTGLAESPEDWVAKVVSIQGNVQGKNKENNQWIQIKMDDIFFAGDMIRVQKHSRAAILLQSQAIVRLDQETTITFSKAEKEKSSLLKMLSGAAYFFSRIPRSLKVVTPFVNASVEGTEFFIKVDENQTLLSIFKGRVAAVNDEGSLVLAGGYSAIVKMDQPPKPIVIVRFRDAVQWALNYPPILDFKPTDFQGVPERNWHAIIRDSIRYYNQGDLTNAFSSLESVPENIDDPIDDPRFFTYRAMLLLFVGRIVEASDDIQNASFILNWAI